MCMPGYAQPEATNPENGRVHIASLPTPRRRPPLPRIDVSRDIALSSARCAVTVRFVNNKDTRRCVYHLVISYRL